MSGSTTVPRHRNPLQRKQFKFLLVCGFFTLGSVILVAHRKPASGFELSLYDSTPVVFWAGVSISMFIGVVVTIFAQHRNRVRGALLSGLVFASIVSLPILRGYYFFGEYDSLTHIGWVKNIQAGVISPFELFYPGLHELTILIEVITGFPVPKSLLFVVVLFPICFVLFLALTVYELVGSEQAAVIGLFSGMLLLPINHVATHYMAPHPFSETVLYSSLLIYLMLLYLKRSAVGMEMKVPLAGLFAAASLGMLFFHPMEAAIFVVILGVTAVTQATARNLINGSPLRTHERMYGLAAFHTAAFALWTADKPVFTGTVDQVFGEIRRTVFGGGAEPASVVQHQSTSLTAVGSGLGDIFLKLFFVSLLFVGLSGALSLASFSGRLEGRFSPVKYLIASLFILAPISLLFFVGNVSKLFFRVHGSIMVLVTILGAVAIQLLIRYSLRYKSRSIVQIAVSITICLFLIHSMMIVYTSPYIYKSNRQVSQAEFTGYETAFSQQGEDIRYAGIRTGPSRYMHAIYGRATVPPSKALVYHSYAETASVPGANLTDLDGYFQEDHYLIVTTRDIKREVGAYRGLRYNESEFDAIQGQTDVHRVQSNGVFRLYLYDNQSSNVEAE